MTLKPPFPYFGGKAGIATEVWRRFGNPPNYVEPFFGGGAVLLARPNFDYQNPPIETINDINAWICNFFRAVQADPDGVARYADWPVSELDLHARGDALFYKGVILSEKNGKRLMKPDEFAERLRNDPEWYDSKIAGFWVWGQSSCIGNGWGRTTCRARPHLGNAGHGVNRQLPSIDDGEWGERIRLYMRQLCARLRRVRVCCGDWRRVLTPTVTEAHGMTAVFLDPPYAVEDRDSVYGDDDSKTLAHDVRAWCIENGDNPLLRTALCGYEEHNEMEAHGWTRHAWKARGGYGSNNKRGNANAGRETIWFSPRCLGADNDMFNTKGANEDENETDYRSNHVV